MLQCEYCMSMSRWLCLQVFVHVLCLDLCFFPCQCFSSLFVLWQAGFLEGRSRFLASNLQQQHHSVNKFQDGRLSVLLSPLLIIRAYLYKSLRARWLVKRPAAACLFYIYAKKMYGFCCVENNFFLEGKRKHTHQHLFAPLSSSFSLTLIHTQVH